MYPAQEDVIASFDEPEVIDQIIGFDLTEDERKELNETLLMVLQSPASIILCKSIKSILETGAKRRANEIMDMGKRNDH